MLVVRAQNPVRVPAPPPTTPAQRSRATRCPAERVPLPRSIKSRINQSPYAAALQQRDRPPMWTIPAHARRNIGPHARPSQRRPPPDRGPIRQQPATTRVPQTTESTAWPTPPAGQISAPIARVPRRNVIAWSAGIWVLVGGSPRTQGFPSRCGGLGHAGSQKSQRRRGANGRRPPVRADRRRHRPLFQARLCRVADRHHLLWLGIHHIVCDGASVSTVLGLSSRGCVDSSVLAQRPPNSDLPRGSGVLGALVANSPRVGAGFWGALVGGVVPHSGFRFSVRGFEHAGCQKSPHRGVIARGARVSGVTGWH
jgi:hypothetical protein